MSYAQQTRSLYNAHIASTSIRYVTYPDAATAVTLTGGKSWVYGAWAEIEAAATFTADYWICGLFVAAAAVDSFEVGVGVGAAGSESVRVILPFDGNDVSGGHVFVPYPVKVAASTRLAARAANAAAGAANTLTAKVVIATGVE